MEIIIPLILTILVLGGGYLAGGIVGLGISMIISGALLFGTFLIWQGILSSRHN